MVAGLREARLIGVEAAHALCCVAVCATFSFSFSWIWVVKNRKKRERMRERERERERESVAILALTTGQVVRRARADLESAGVLCPGGWRWYIDDGQLAVHPTKVDCILRALDRRLERAGASWGSKALGHKVKNSVKAYIPEDEVEACRGWWSTRAR